MSHAITVAEKYFVLSNQSDMVALRAMLSDWSTYSSTHTGVYLSADQIMDMMTDFHGSFRQLQWTIQKIAEVRTGVVEVDFVFNGITKNDQLVERSGREYLIVVGEKLQHIEVLTA